MVKKKIIKRGSIGHVEEEKERLGKRFNPRNEEMLQNLPYDLDINTIPVDMDIRAPLPSPLPTITEEPIPGSTTTKKATKPDVQTNIFGTGAAPDRSRGDVQKEENVIDADYQVQLPPRSVVRDLHDKYNREKNAIKDVLGMDQNFAGVGEYGENVTDKYAIEGGAKYLSGYIKKEEQRLDKLDEMQRSRLSELDMQYDSYKIQSMKDSKKWIEFSHQLDALKSKPNRTPEEDSQLIEMTVEQEKLYKRYITTSKKLESIDQDRRKLAFRIKDTEKDIKEIKERKAEYDKSVVVGRQKYNREHSWRREWMQPIAENVGSMIGAPMIGDISKQVGYGDVSARSVTSGINSLFGNYKLNPGANEWVKTKAGDRGLVEALVKVNQNNMITPFGAPGTIQNSRLGNQFNYNLPVRQIAIGDVTARPGYRITPEDVKRKKGDKKPAMIRNKIKVSKVPEKKKSSLKKVTVRGNLSLNYQPMIATIGKSSNNNLVKIDKNKTMLDLDNITPFTSKNFEVNINTMSKPILKKKLLKVNI